MPYNPVLGHDWGDAPFDMQWILVEVPMAIKQNKKSGAKFGPNQRLAYDAKARHDASGGTTRSNERVRLAKSGARAGQGESGGTTRSNERVGPAVSGVSGTSDVNGLIDASGAINTSRVRAQHVASVTNDATD
ncbi:hypothetical protein ACFE04_022802 [Oxalis oulophora]